jgi:hypothetical protein
MADFDLDLDVDAIDEQIRMLQSLRKLATDANMRSLIAKFAKHKNGNGGHGGQVAPAVAQPRRREHGGLRSAVEEALESIDKSPFSSADVVAKMGDIGYVFQAKNPQIAVNEVLKWLSEEEGKVEFTGNRIGAQKLWVMTSVENNRTA